MFVANDSHRLEVLLDATEVSVEGNGRNVISYHFIYSHKTVDNVQLLGHNIK